MGVMHDRMDGLADQFFRRPAQHALGGRIDEGGLALGVDAVDAFAGGAQDQLVLALDVLEHALDPLPGRDAAAHVVFGRRVDIAAAAGIEVAQGEQHQRRGRRRGTREPAYSSLSVCPVGVARGQRVGPVRALVEHGLGEHDQRGQLAGMQRADPGLPQQRAVIAEQGAGGRVGVQDQVGVGIEQQRRLDRELERCGMEIDIGAIQPQRRELDPSRRTPKFRNRTTKFRLSRIFVMANIRRMSLRHQRNRRRNGLACGLLNSRAAPVQEASCPPSIIHSIPTAVFARRLFVRPACQRGRT